MGSVDCVRIGWSGRTVEGSLLDSVVDGGIWESGVGEQKVTNDREGRWAPDIETTGTSGSQLLNIIMLQPYHIRLYIASRSREVFVPSMMSPIISCHFK